MPHPRPLVRPTERSYVVQANVGTTNKQRSHHDQQQQRPPGSRPGGTGAVGEGIVRAFLNAGADVVVPTRTPQRADEFRQVLGSAATDRLHLVVHDYTTFAGAEGLAAEMERRLGGIDDVVAPIGGWWAGKKLWEIDEADWQTAFVGLATTHMAVMRATVPRLSALGAYTLIVGTSAFTPIPGSGLVSMEQAALSMMTEVLRAEQKRAFTLVLGPVRTRVADSGDVTADQVGEIAVAATTGGGGGGEIRVRDRTEFEAAMGGLSLRR
ncbi:SDR family NAD(P)-dependent oxidoreductase [Winogradskya consettensis]|uniref:SDR family NAD(P)-dependent oxidoreductase n=1 Tax=Winogradskya consettensis TaxID=113560 RepID=UPI0024575C85